jgi:undecaprenyl-diphosphatase
MSASMPATQQDPTVARHSPRGWWRWLVSLARFEPWRIEASGLALLLGFVLGVMALALFAWIAEDVARQQTVQLDDAVLAWLRQRQSPTLDVVAQAVSRFGSEGVLAFLVLLVAWFGRQRQWGAAVSLVLVVVGAQLLNDVLKELFHRTRPAPVAGILTAQQFSFPSGHAMVSAAFYSFIAYVTWRTSRSWKRTAWVALLLVLVLLIGVSRLYLAAHYFSDVVAGYVAGFIWTDSVVVAGQLLSRRKPPVLKTPEPARDSDEVDETAARRPADVGPARAAR